MSEQKGQNIYLSAFARAELSLNDEQEISAELKRNHYTKEKTGTYTSGYTRSFLAEKASVSSENIRKVKKILQTIRDDVFLEKCRSGEITINSAYQLLALREEERSKVFDELRQGEGIRNVLAREKAAGNISQKYPGDQFLQSAKLIMKGAMSVWKLGDDVPTGNRLFADLRDAGHNLEMTLKQLELTTAGPKWEQWVVVVPATTSAGWFQGLCRDSDGICLVAGQSCAVIYHGNNNQGFVQEFERYGYSV